MIWLGEKRGFLSDWLTQQWVRATGKNINLSNEPWLDGPTGGAASIGADCLSLYARANGLEIVSDGIRGLIPHWEELALSETPPIAPAVKQFYENTSAPSAAPSRSCSAAACNNSTCRSPRSTPAKA